jgi:hypothetical protein
MVPIAIRIECRFTAGEAEGGGGVFFGGFEFETDIAGPGGGRGFRSLGFGLLAGEDVDVPLFVPIAIGKRRSRRGL